MAELKPLLPLAWPPDKRDGDKLVPVIRGREAVLFCVYVLAPTESRTPIKIGYTGQLTKRLPKIRNAYWYASDERIDLFWSAWFEHESRARQIEAMTYALLESKRVRNKSEWFRVTPEWGRQAILVAAHKAEIPVISHESYVSLCRWKSDLPLECRLPGKQRGVREAAAQRVRNAVELACYVAQEAKHADNY
jgi:hypothetical protein